MIEITSKQRKVLEKAAHSLEPVVIVGQNGVTDSLTEKVAQSLEAHELIKVKFNDFKDDKRELKEKLGNSYGALHMKIKEKITNLYKEQEKKKKRKIKI